MWAAFSYKAINAKNEKEQAYIFYEGIIPCGKPVRVQKITDSENPEPPDLSKAEYVSPTCLNSISDLEPGFGVVRYITDVNNQPSGFNCVKGQIAVAKELSCQLCHVVVMAKNFVDFWLIPPNGMAYILGGVIFAGGFFLMALAPLFPFIGDVPTVVQRAKKMMLNVVWGLLLMLFAWVITNTVIWILGVADWTGLQHGWWKVNCPIVAPPEFFQ